MSIPLLSKKLYPIYKFETVISEFADVLLWDTNINVPAEFPTKLYHPTIFYGSQLIFVKNVTLKRMKIMFQLCKSRFIEPTSPKLTVVTNANGFDEQVICKLWDRITMFYFASNKILTEYQPQYEKKYQTQWSNQKSSKFGLFFRVTSIFLKKTTTYWIPRSVNDGILKKFHIQSNEFQIIRFDWAGELAETCDQAKIDLPFCIHRVTKKLRFLTMKAAEINFINELCGQSTEDLKVKLFESKGFFFKKDYIVNSLINYKSFGGNFEWRHDGKNFLHSIMYLIFFPELS